MFPINYCGGMGSALGFKDNSWEGSKGSRGQGGGYLRENPGDCVCWGGQGQSSGRAVVRRVRFWTDFEGGGDGSS